MADPYQQTLNSKQSPHRQALLTKQLLEIVVFSIIRQQLRKQVVTHLTCKLINKRFLVGWTSCPSFDSANQMYRFLTLSTNEQHLWHDRSKSSQPQRA